jgi:hypothetical protein
MKSQRGTRSILGEPSQPLAPCPGKCDFDQGTGQLERTFASAAAGKL